MREMAWHIHEKLKVGIDWVPLQNTVKNWGKYQLHSCIFWYWGFQNLEKTHKFAFFDFSCFLPYYTTTTTTRPHILSFLVLWVAPNFRINTNFSNYCRVFIPFWVCSNTTQKTLLKEKKCHFCSNIIPWLSPIYVALMPNRFWGLFAAAKNRKRTHIVLWDKEPLLNRFHQETNPHSTVIATLYQQTTLWIDSNWFHVSFRSRKLQCVSLELYQCLHNHFYLLKF